MDQTLCPCYCYGGGPYTPCSVTGGCGHLHTEHRCRRADRCADWDLADALDTDGTRIRVRIGAPINSDGLCPTCVRRTETALAELPVDYTELTVILGRGGGNGLAEPVAVSPELVVPVRLDVEALLSGMVAEATCWAEAVAERLRVTWDSRLVDRHTRPGPALQRACRLLGAAMSPWLAIRDWACMAWTPGGTDTEPVTRDGVDGAVTLLDMHYQARRLCGMTRLVHRLPVDCWQCGRRALIRHNGDDHVWCSWCDRWWTAEDYTTATRVLAAAAAGA